MIGIDPAYYLDCMSQDEVATVLRAWRKDKDQELQDEWERTRMLSYYSATAFGAPTIPGVGPVKKPSDLFSLPWDDINSDAQVKPKAKPLTKEEFKERAEAVKRSMDKNKRKINS